jgi:hypothetical protein
MTLRHFTSFPRALWSLFVTAIEIVIVAMLLVTTIVLDLLCMLIEQVLSLLDRYLSTRRI